MRYSSNKVTSTKMMYKTNMATPVNLFIWHPQATIVVTTISNMANSSTVEQNIPSLLTVYACPPVTRLYINHGNGSLETTATLFKGTCNAAQRNYMRITLQCSAVLISDIWYKIAFDKLQRFIILHYWVYFVIRRWFWCSGHGPIFALFYYLVYFFWVLIDHVRAQYDLLCVECAVRSQSTHL